MNLQEVGSFIAERRKLKNLTQDKLGEKIGVSGKTISKWERGVNAPDISLLNKLSEILEVDVSEILNGKKGEKKSSNEKLIENIAYYTKRERLKYIRILFNTLFILFILFSTLFTINNYNQFRVYSIMSKDSNYFVEGSIVFNQERNLIVIKNIDIKDKNMGTDLEEKIRSIKISLESKNKNIFSVFYETESYEIPINTFLLNKAYCSDENVDSNENIISKNIDLKNMNLKIEYINSKDEKKEIVIPLYIEKDYSNNRLFY